MIATLALVMILGGGGTANPVDTPEEWAPIVDQYFDEGKMDIAMSIIECESRFDPEADNPVSTAQGGWQFLKGTWERSAAMSGYDVDPYPIGPNDPIQSTRLAAWLQKEAGWTQWTCYGLINKSEEWSIPIDITSDPLTLNLDSKRGR